MIAADVIELARDTLNDPDGIRWIDVDMLRWLGDGLRAASQLRPAAAATVVSHLLTAGETEQDLPADAFMLLDIRRNMGSDGLTVGKQIRDVDYGSLLNFDTDWHTQATGATVIDGFAYRMAVNPLKFWVTPRPHDSTPVYVDLVYAKTFSNPDTMSSELPLGEEYKLALSEFLVGKALNIDSDTGDGKAEQHFGAFASAIGGLAGGDAG